MKLVLTVGGKGTRLQPLTYDIPKPMLPLAGKPVLEYAIEWAKRNGLTEIIICAGYLANHIIEHFGDGSNFGVKIKYSIEKEPLGTGGAIRNAKELIAGDDFILLHGDVLCKVDAKKMIGFHRERNAICTLAAHKSNHPEDSDLIEKDEKGKVVKFWRKPHTETPPTDLGNSGLHVFKAEALGLIPEGNVSLEKEVIPLLEKTGRLYAYHTEEFLKDMGTFERMKILGEKIGKEGWWDW